MEFSLIREICFPEQIHYYGCQFDQKGPHKNIQVGGLNRDPLQQAEESDYC